MNHVRQLNFYLPGMIRINGKTFLRKIKKKVQFLFKVAGEFPITIYQVSAHLVNEFPTRTTF